jgi:mono/diheme cytochrome c family protein
VRGLACMGIGAAGIVAAGLLGAVLFVASGAYDIGADDHHLKIVLRSLEQLRERSISAHSRAIVVPPALDDPQRVGAGARYYAALCVSCHLAPGAVKSQIRTGMYPYPPSLAQEALREAARTFWTIKHGIKMSAMPAWGKSLDDDAIWDVVAFLDKLPNMSPDDYRAAAASP